MNEQGQRLITEEPSDSAYTNEYVEQAIEELGDEVDTVGADFEPIEVTLNEGGN